MHGRGVVTTDDLVRLLDALTRHRTDLRRTVLTRQDVAALRLEKHGRTAVVESPGDWYFSVWVDAGYFLWEPDKEPTDTEVVAALRVSTAAAMAYLDRGGVVERPRRFRRPVLHVTVDGDRVTFDHARRESGLLRSDTGWQVRLQHEPRGPGRGVSATAETRCRVCGLDEDDERFRGAGSAQYVICSCCGAESGVDDVSTTAVRRYRDRWIARGAPWFTEADRPGDWSLHRQLSQISPEWR